MLENILIGVTGYFGWQNLAASFFGTALGIIFGALPGFTATMGVAILIPITFGMSPITGLSLLFGVYCGAIYGGSISAILINTPGTPSGAATALDGFAMNKKGMGADALRYAILGSFVGGIMGCTALLVIAPPLAMFALRFGPPEIFLLAIFGLTIIASITAKSLLKGIIAGLIGLFASTVGVDPLIAYPRFTFGSPYLMDGITLLPALIGLFSMSEMALLVESRAKSIVGDIELKKNYKILPTLDEIRRYGWNALRSSIIGVFIGILPGAGSGIGAWLAYNEARRVSKEPEKFGTGIPDGVIAAETANNAVIGGALIPLLTLGIPGCTVAAVFLGGVLIHGLIPGARLFTDHAQILYPFLIGTFVANVFMLFQGLYGAPLFSRVTKLSSSLLVPGVLVLSAIGSYAINNSIYDVYFMFIFGVLGYFMRKVDLHPAPIVLGLILGPIAEKAFNQTMVIKKGANFFLYLFGRPICVVLILLIILSLLTPYIQDYLSKKRSNGGGETKISCD